MLVLDKVGAILKNNGQPLYKGQNISFFLQKKREKEKGESNFLELSLDSNRNNILLSDITYLTYLSERHIDECLHFINTISVKKFKGEIYGLVFFT